MFDTVVKDRDLTLRHCGDCTACCDGWLKITIQGQSVEPGKRCPFSSGHDCTNYEGRPIDPCQKFICGWLAKESPLPDWLRPDTANVIILAGYFYWQGLPVDVGVPVAGGIQDKALDWLKNFAFSKKRLLVYQVNQDWYAFGPPAFQAEMATRFGKGEQVWALRDSSSA
jgi:hypothetical protein